MQVCYTLCSVFAFRAPWPLGRKAWEDKSAKLGEAFEVGTVAGILSDELLRRARVLHDSLFAGTAASQKAKGEGAVVPSGSAQAPIAKGEGAKGDDKGQKGGGKGDGKGTKRGAEASASEAQSSKKAKGPKCFNCRERGHIAKECTKPKKS